MRMRSADEVVRFDVLVVGAGPAGSRAAELAAESGASVLLVEKRTRVGVPVQCAEFLHTKVVKELEVPSKAIAQHVEGMVTHMFGGPKARSRAPGCILNRDVFDAFLAERAVKAGADLMTGTMAIEPLSGLSKAEGLEGVVLEKARTGKRIRVQTKVIIGADGPSSMVGRWVGQENERMLHAHQRTVRLNERMDVTEVFLHPDYPGGYGWLFPKGDLANVGVGVERALGGRPAAALRDLVVALGDRIGPMVSKTAGLIPVDGPVRTVVGNVMLVGDAGGFTHPITGGGIQQAVATGAMAGDCAARFITGDKGALRDYEKEWGDTFGKVLEHAASRRRRMVLSWKKASEGKDTFAALMRRSWIAFKEYNQD